MQVCWALTLIGSEDIGKFDLLRWELEQCIIIPGTKSHSLVILLLYDFVRPALSILLSLYSQSRTIRHFMAQESARIGINHHSASTTNTRTRNPPLSTTNQPHIIIISPCNRLRVLILLILITTLSILQQDHVQSRLRIVSQTTSCPQSKGECNPTLRGQYQYDPEASCIAPRQISPTNHSCLQRDKLQGVRAHDFHTRSCFISRHRTTFECAG